jgi:hypothetical protein
MPLHQCNRVNRLKQFFHRPVVLKFCRSLRASFCCGRHCRKSVTRGADPLLVQIWVSGSCLKGHRSRFLESHPCFRRISMKDDIKTFVNFRSSKSEKIHLMDCRLAVQHFGVALKGLEVHNFLSFSSTFPLLPWSLLVFPMIMSTCLVLRPTSFLSVFLVSSQTRIVSVLVSPLDPPDSGT